MLANYYNLATFLIIRKRQILFFGRVMRREAVENAIMTGKESVVIEAEIDKGMILEGLRW